MKDQEAGNAVPLIEALGSADIEPGSSHSLLVAAF